MSLPVLVMPLLCLLFRNHLEVTVSVPSCNIWQDIIKRLIMPSPHLRLACRKQTSFLTSSFFSLSINSEKPDFPLFDYHALPVCPVYRQVCELGQLLLRSNKGDSGAITPLGIWVSSSKLLELSSHSQISS